MIAKRISGACGAVWWQIGPLPTRSVMHMLKTSSVKVYLKYDYILDYEALMIMFNYKGIPHHFRGVVWPLLCGANDSPAKSQYAEYIKATSACEKVIRRDIARTYPEHDFFKEKDGLGQESLFNVMKAYSLHDREVGYCQGSAFIVGILLMQVCLSKKERKKKPIHQKIF